MGVLLALDSSDDIRTVGRLGAFLAKTVRADIKIARGFVVPINKHVGYGLSNEILRAFDKLEVERVILRASPVHGEEETETIEAVERDNLVEAVANLQSSMERRWRPSAIIVQEHLNGELYGQIHSKNIYTGADDEIVIEAKLWATNSVLGDDYEPEMTILNKRDGTVELESEEGESLLDADQAQQLYRAVRKVEKAVDAPVSLDWAFVNGVLYILKTRLLNA